MAPGPTAEHRVLFEEPEVAAEELLDVDVSAELPPPPDEAVERIPPQVAFVEDNTEIDPATLDGPSGVPLTKDLIQSLSFLSQLGRSADGLQLVYLCFSAVGQSLANISMLCEYPHLQIVDLENNSIEDVSVLARLPSVVYLNVGHNRLTDLLAGFQCPANLRDVNLSHNQISEMRDLSDIRFLNQLFLDHNRITTIAGLDSLKHLKLLSLRENQIEAISGLDEIRLKELYLAGNKIAKIDNLDKQDRLELLDLSQNQIEAMHGLENLESLQILNLADNQIQSLDDVRAVSALEMLRRMDLSGNPIQAQENYRPTVVMMTYSLATLDKTHLSAEEKVGAKNLFQPPHVPAVNVEVGEAGEVVGEDQNQ